MPIYEFACPKCRVIFNFLSKRLRPAGKPVCPQCGNKRMRKQVSAFSMITGPAQQDSGEEDKGDPGVAEIDDSKMLRAMGDIERDMAHMDENNPKHMALMMRKMQEALPQGMLPKEMDTAIKRLEAGEDPDKVEEDMGDILNDTLGNQSGTAGGGYQQDPGLYDY
jgi:putative FmdB family regulatory protein